MGIRELREAYWKACTWRPPVVAIIEYLARLDIRFAAISQNVDAVDTEIEEIESQFGSLDSAIAALQGQMQGAYVRFSGSSDTTANSSPYRKRLAIDTTASKIYDPDMSFATIMNVTTISFAKAGRVKVEFGAKFASAQSGQHVAVASSMSASSTSYDLGVFRGNAEEPRLSVIVDVETTTTLYFFCGGGSSTVRTFTPNSPMTFAHIRYIEKS